MTRTAYWLDLRGVTVPPSVAAIFARHGLPLVVPVLAPASTLGATYDVDEARLRPALVQALREHSEAAARRAGETDLEIVLKRDKPLGVYAIPDGARITRSQPRA